MFLINYISVAMFLLGFAVFLKYLHSLSKASKNADTGTIEGVEIKGKNLVKGFIATVVLIFWLMVTSVITNHINTFYLSSKAKPYTSSQEFKMGDKGDIKDIQLKPIKTLDEREKHVDNILTARKEVKEIVKQD